jgi:hypothetical protein
MSTNSFPFVDAKFNSHHIILTTEQFYAKVDQIAIAVPTVNAPRNVEY